MLAFIAISFVGCKKFLDRPAITSVTDENAWENETHLRLYSNKFYPTFFTGYGLSFNYTGSALMGYQFSDDVFVLGNQTNFNRSVPNNSAWNMNNIRSINAMVNNIDNRMKDKLAPEAFAHWMGIGRFFRGIEYADLVTRYGDIPYYDHVVSDVDTDDLYKPRTPRNEVMDHVYDDLKFAMENVRLSDGDQYLNRFSVAGFISRAALTEASWQKYYYNNDERARKFFELAVEAGDLVISSGKYDIVTDFRTLFTSNTLAGNRDVLLYRHYDAGAGITHAIASNNNLAESVAFGPTTDLIKSFICVDGKAWQNSAEANANSFTLANMIKTRDSRLEASFYEKPHIRNRSSYWYINKFIPRSVVDSVAAGKNPPSQYAGDKNETDYPVLRYAEVLLNWIEAKAELGNADQSDIARSINKIRNRPLAPEAIAKGVKQTAPMELNNLTMDPDKDSDVSPLIWEIRRERRMEFAFEYGRYEDLKRWKKLNHMDTDLNPDILSGGWVNFQTELPGELVPSKEGGISVVDMSGNVIIYKGTNKAAMNGFYRATATGGRLPFLNQTNVNPYLLPLGKLQIEDYRSKGYVLTQTEGWPQE
jgi:hypothetical protein